MKVTTIQRSTLVQPTEVSALQADRTKADELSDALVAAHPDVVIDMIAMRESDSTTLINVLPASVCRLVVISSGDVYASYGRFLGLPTELSAPKESDESAPLRSSLFPYRKHATGTEHLLYNYEKILVERATKAWSGSVTVLRLPMVYGPGDPQHRVAKAWERLQASGTTVRLNAAEASWRTTRGYVEDVAAAITLAALAPEAAGETFNIGEPDALSQQEWLKAIAIAGGWQGDIVADATIAPSRSANWDVSLVVRTTRLRTMLGYREPVGRTVGLQRAIAELRAEAA
jgi:nucleoside-diphosphate-sugar epimerase